MKNLYFFIISLFALNHLPVCSHSQIREMSREQAPYEVARITCGIIFDGIPDEAVWECIDALPLIMYRPVFGEAPTAKNQSSKLHTMMNIFMHRPGFSTRILTK
jgi:hypothetical protein